MKEKDKLMNDMTINPSDNQDDDIVIENTGGEFASLKKEYTKENKTTNHKDKYSDLTEEEMKKMISAYDPPKIKDWPNIPYKTIMISLLLFFSSILFLYTAVTKYKENETWDQYLSYFALGFMLIIPGAYYTFMLISILLGREGYEYKHLPKLNN